jgi:antitoxin HicB
MRREFTYPVTITPAAEHAPGETGFVVTFLDFPEAITQGDSFEEALLEAADCLEEAIANRTRRRMEIPSPSPIGPEAHVVSVSATVAIKAALAVAMREAGVNNVGLASVLGKDEKEVRRLLDPAHASKLGAIEDALRPLGKRVRIVIEDAA